MSSRARRVAVSIVLAMTLAVPPVPFDPPPVQAHTYTGADAHAAFAAWRIEATQIYTSEGGPFSSEERTDWVYDRLSLGGLSWSTEYEGHWVPDPQDPCPAGYDQEGLGQGLIPNDQGIVGPDPGADDFGLSSQGDWTYQWFSTGSEHPQTYTIVTTHYSCLGGGVSEGEQQPYFLPVFLPGTPAELNAMPIGTVIENSYQCGQGSCVSPGITGRVISYTATKQGAPPVCEGYQHEVNAVGGHAGSSLFNFDSVVTFRVCEPADGGLSVVDEVTAVNSYASLDAGVLAGTLSALGFDFRLRVDGGQPIPEPVVYQYAENAFEVTTQNGFDVCFDFMALLDRVGMRQGLANALTKVLLRPLERLMRGPYASLDDIVNDWSVKRWVLASDFEGYVDDLLGRVPLAHQLGLSSFAVNEFDAFLDRVDAVVASGAGNAVAAAGAHYIASEIGGLIANLYSSVTTACFEVWEPTITHHVFVGLGSAVHAHASLGSNFTNPFVWSRVELDELRD